LLCHGAAGSTLRKDYSVYNTIEGRPGKKKMRRKKRLAGTPVLGLKEEKKKHKKVTMARATARGIIVELVSSQGRNIGGLRTPVADRDS
jgi:hypothetical protein